MIKMTPAGLHVKDERDYAVLPSQDPNKVYGHVTIEDGAIT